MLDAQIACSKPACVRWASAYAHALAVCGDLPEEYGMEPTPLRVASGGRWHDCSKVWEKLEALGRERDAQKARYRSTRNWAKGSTHFLGLVGEYIVSLESGLRFDATTRKRGDDGKDFVVDGKRVDVKASPSANPRLFRLASEKKWADYYVLVAVDVPRKRARVVGWAFGPMLAMAPTVEYGYGPTRMLTADQLGPGLPPGMRRA